MAEFYVIVIGEDPEGSLKRAGDHLRSWKESNWLYDGLVLTADFTMTDLATKLTANPALLPAALIDNGHWISRQMVGDGWQKSLVECLHMTTPGQPVNIYTCT